MRAGTSPGRPGSIRRRYEPPARQPARSSRAASSSRSSHNDADESSTRDDDFPDLFAFEILANLRIRKSSRLQVLLADVGRYRQPGPHLAVDLHGDDDLIGLRDRLI